MNYEILLSRHAEKFLEAMGSKDYKIVSRHIDLLKSDAHPHGSIKLKGSDNLYRLRVGNFRIIYEPNEKEVKIFVLDIGDRKNIYKK